MTYLLDTHTFLWFISADPALPPAVRARSEAPDAVRYLSVGSLWEMAIKVNAGKLSLGMAFPPLIDPHVVSQLPRRWRTAASGPAACISKPHI